MKIWLLATSEKCTAINLENNDDYSNSVEKYFNNETNQWKPVRVVTRRKGNKSDCAEFILGYPVFMKRAKDILSPMLGEGVEFLPVLHDVHDMYIVQVKNTQDFIDMSNPVERRINYGYFSEYVHIFPEKVDHAIPIFKMDPNLSTRVYVTDDFKKIVEENKLKGFEFIPLWDTDYTEADRKEHLKQFDCFYDRILSREIVDFNTATQIINNKKQVRCGKHILIAQNGDMLVGQLFEDETIQYIKPKYIAPGFFDMKWMVYDDEGERQLIEDYMAELSYEINGPKGKLVVFEDEGLEAIIRNELKIFKEDINDKLLLKLQSILPVYKGLPVKSLVGVEQAYNLRHISIENSSNFNIHELKRLPPNVLSMSLIKCDLDNIETLKDINLSKLVQLDISSNKIEDLSSLAKFPNLTRIDARSNKIKDIRPLNELKALDSLILRDNPVENIQELKLPKLRSFYVEGIRTSNWEFLLTNFPNLETVYISGEGMSDEEKKSIKNIKKQKKLDIITN